MKVKGIAKLLSVVMTLTCISFPAVTKAADSDESSLKPIVKENLYNNGNWGDYINTFAYGVGGDMNGYMDYSNTSKSTFADNTWTAEINDNTLTEDQLITRSNEYYGFTPSSNGTVVNPKTGADGMIEYALGWGYRGFSPFWNTTGTDAVKANNKYTAGTVDIRDYDDNGYVVYNINVEGQNLDGVYLTVGYHNNLWDLGYYQSPKYDAVNQDKNFDNTEALDTANANWKNGTGNYMSIRYRGVKLSDYYDAEIGGFQTIKVPISEFANNATFKKRGGKIDGIKTDDDTTEFNPALIKTIGIAREDSHNNVNFTSQIKEVKLVSIEAPTDFSAEADEDGKVLLIWGEVNSDVTYQIKKTVDGEASYIDLEAGETSYYDEDVDTNDKSSEVRYSIIAKNAAYDLSAETEEKVFNETVQTTALKDRIFVPGNYSNYMSTWPYAVGWATEWLDYKTDLGSDFEDGVWIASMNDNTFTDDQLVLRSEYNEGAVASGVKANPHTDESSGMIEKATGWGYRGFVPVWKTDGSEEVQAGNKYPAAVMDLREYADNGSISYTINVEDQNIDDVYLTIGTYKDFWDLGWYWDGEMASKFSYNSTYIDADKLDEIKAPNGTEATWRRGNGSYRTVRLAGVKLSDYYDMEKGGFQTINVPISDFVNKSTFRKMAGKIASGDNILQSGDDTQPVNLGLVRTIGIARMDSHNGTTFTSKIKDVAVIAPAAVRDFAGTYNKSTGAVKLTWKESTEKNIAKVQLVKSVNGVKSYIDLASDATSYTDTIDPASKKEVRYSVVVTESEFNAQASTSEFIINEKTETTALKKKMVNGNGAAWSYDISSLNGYVGGPTNQYGDYAGETPNDTTNKIFTTSINDNTLTADQLDSKGNNPMISGDTNPAKGMIEPNTGWGIKGMQIEGYANSGLPSGVVDLLDYEDGYAVFNVRIDEGDLDGVYASIVYANTLIDINGFYGDNHNVWDSKDLRNTDLLDATYGTDAWKNISGFVRFRVAGVKLSDYYDMEQGGFQTVKIPLKKFTTNPDFRATYEKGKYLKEETETSTMNLNLGLVKGMGIARADMDPNKVSNFKFSYKDLAFVAPAAVENVKAEKVTNGVKVTWDESTDTDVTHKLVKVSNRQTTEITVTGAEYLDTSIGANDEAVYYIVSTDNTYGTTAESAKFYYNVPENASEILLDFGAGNAASDTSEAVVSNWYMGSGVSVWGEYEGANASAIVGRGDDAVHKFWIVDNNYEHSVETVDRGRIIHDTDWTYYGETEPRTAEHSYALTGFEFNEKVDTYKDMSDHKDGYIVMNVKFEEPNGGTLNLDGSYFTVDYAWDPWAIQNTNGEWLSGARRIYRTAVAGVKASDYYDASKGGYQQVVIPLSAFTNAEEPDFRGVKTRENDYATYNAKVAENKYDFATYIKALKGVGVAREDKANKSGIAYSVKGAYIVGVPAPRNLKAAYNNGKVNVTWNDASVEGVTQYEIYRDGKKLTVVDGISYTDTDATSGSHTYAVKTISPNYAGATSASAEATVVVPVTREIKVYAGAGESRKETKYVSAGAMEVDLMAVAAGTQGYVAVYDANGVLKTVKIVALGSDTARTIGLTGVLATDTVKAFIWDSNMSPVCDETVVGTRGTRVLVIGDEVSAQGVEYLGDIAAAEGKNIEVTSIYATAATMHNHYENVKNNSYVYTKTVDGVAAKDMVSAKEVINEGDWDYVILQDRAVYDGFAEYYDSENNGAAYTEIPVIVNAIKAASETAKIFTNESLGFDNTWYNEQSEDLQNYINDMVGGNTWEESFMATMTIAGSIADMTDKVSDVFESGYISTHDTLLASYTGEAVMVDGINLTASGKYAASVAVYRAVTNGANVTSSYVPVDVVDAEGILAALNA